MAEKRTARKRRARPEGSPSSLLSLVSPKDVERKFIDLDGKPFYLRHPSQFRMKHLVVIEQAAAAMQQIVSGNGQASDDDFDKAEEGLDQVIRTIIDGDPEPILALPVGDRMSVASAFSGNVRGVQGSPPKASSPDSSGSTDSTRSD